MPRLPATQPHLERDPPDDRDPTDVQGATMCLLVQCLTEGTCPGRAKAVFEHLRWLARHEALDPGLRDRCWALAARWVRWRVEALEPFAWPQQFAVPPARVQ